MARRPKCASNGDILVTFFRHILSSWAICLKDCFLWKGRSFGSSLMHPSLRLTVCINRSTSPIDLWSFAWANIIIMLFRLHNSLIILPVWHLAWFIRIDPGTPFMDIYLFRKCSMFIALALLYNISDGNFENRSMHARKYTSLPCLSSIAPSKSIWISSFGSTHGIIGDHFVFGIILLRFLPNSVQGRHVLALFIRSLLLKGHQSLVPSSVIPHEPGWVACRTSMTASFNVLRIVRRLSRRMQPSFTLSWFQWAYICLLTALHRRSSFWMMQSRIFLRMLSLFFTAANNVELNTSLIALSSVVFAVEGVVVSSLFGPRYVVKESGVFAGLFGECSLLGLDLLAFLKYFHLR